MQTGLHFSLIGKSLDKGKKTSAPEPAKPNLLVNDGNFLERFRQMQQGITGKGTSSGSADKLFIHQYDV